MNDLIREIELEDTLAQSAVDPTKRPDFYRLLIASSLYVIDENPNASGDESLQLRTIEAEGETYVPVFTSVVQIKQFTEEEVGYVRIAATDLLPLLKDSLLVLNPGSDYGKILIPEEIEAILDGSILNAPVERNVSAGSAIQIVEPQGDTSYITTVLSEYFQTNESVGAAYLAHYKNVDEDEEPHIIIGIYVVRDWEKTIEDVSWIIKDKCHSDHIIDVIQLGNSELSRYLVLQTKPFYKKTSGQ